MNHDITMLTLPQPIGVGRDSPEMFAPWGGGQPIDLAGVTVSTVAISDDDGFFNSGLYVADETGQRLVAATTFGSGGAAVTVPAGTQMSMFIASFIESDTGERFVAVFPHPYIPDDFGTEFGGRHSVLLFPVPRNGVEPVFDPAARWHFAGIRDLGSASEGIAYPTGMPSGPVCMAEGTLVLTPSGPRPIQDLVVGDLVETADAGPQPIRWIGTRRMDAADLDLRPDHRPIRLERGALAPDVPNRDLVLSPQHRVLIRSRVARRMAGKDEVLVAARHLAGLPGITVLAADHVTYWHMLLPGHHLIRTEGAWTESLYPGPMALRSLGPDSAARIMELMPALRHGILPEPARPLIPGRQARSLARRLLQNNRPAVEA